jgi:hypothetical protein
MTNPSAVSTITSCTVAAGIAGTWRVGVSDGEGELEAGDGEGIEVFVGKEVARDGVRDLVVEPL